MQGRRLQNCISILEGSCIGGGVGASFSIMEECIYQDEKGVEKDEKKIFFILKMLQLEGTLMPGRAQLEMC